MKLIYLLLKSSARHFWFAIFAGICSGVCNAFMINLINESVETQMPDMMSFIVQFVLFWVGFGITNQVAVYFSIRLTNQAMFEMRMNLVNQVLHSSFQKVEHGILKVLSVFTQDIITVTNTINRLPAILTALSTVLGCFVYLVIVSWKLFIGFILMILLVYSIMRILLPKVKFYADKTRGVWDQLFEYFEGLIYGLKELMLNKNLRESYSNDFLPALFGRQNHYALKQNMIFALSNRSVEIVFFLGLATILITIKQTEFVSFTLFSQFLGTLLFILSPLATLSNFVNEFKKTEVAIDRINDVETTLSSAKFLEGDRAALEVQNSDEPLIQLHGVKHKYFNIEEDESFELGPIDISIKRGEVIFLVGGNGSGKTTLAKLIVGLYQPESGFLSYAGQPLTNQTYDDFRNRISANFTDQYLFQSLSHIEDDVLAAHSEKYLESLELTKKVKIKDKKFSTTSLSQGQKKRLSLLASLLEDKEVYLFDEWAANQDPHFKNIFYHELLPDLKKRGKTILVISHDESYFGDGDRVIVLEDGHIKEKSPVKKQELKG